MCGISDKLTLCTCNEQDVMKMSDYWILYKPKKPKIVGQTMLPYYWDEKEAELTRTTAKKIQLILNQRDCFDKKLEIRKGDLLKLVFDKTSLDGRRKDYKFKFIENEWVYLEDAANDIYFNELKKGKIEN